MKKKLKLSLAFLFLSILCLQIVEVKFVLADTMASGLTFKSVGASREMVFVGGHIYEFWQDPSSKFIVYNSSVNGVTWSESYEASDTPAVTLSGVSEYTVGTDGNKIFLGYINGTESTVSNSSSFMIRVGTPNEGTISWDKTIAVAPIGGYASFSYCNTTNYSYFAINCYIPSTGYVTMLYNGTASSDSWQRVALLTGYSGNNAAVYITSWSEYEDGVIAVEGRYASSSYTYYKYFGNTTISTGTSFATKTANKYDHSISSLVTNPFTGEIEFVTSQTPTTGSSLLYYNFNSSAWSSPITVVSESTLFPSLSMNTLSGELYIFYTNATGVSAIYYKTMNLSTHTLSEASVFASNQNIHGDYGCISSLQYSYDVIMASWMSNNILTYEIKDIASPILSEITSNNTVADASVELSCNITDDVGIDCVIPSWNNTGSWVNSTALDAGNAASYIANFTGTWNSTVGNVVSVKFYANDTAGNWGTSTQYNFTLTADTYTITITYSPTGIILKGDTVLFTLNITGDTTGTALTSFFANITRDGEMFRQDWNQTTFDDTEEEAMSHSYNVSGLEDSDGTALTYTCTATTVTWSSGNGGGSGGSGDTDTPTPTPDGDGGGEGDSDWWKINPFKTINVRQQDIIIFIVLSAIAVLAASALFSVKREPKRKHKQRDLFETLRSR